MTSPHVPHSPFLQHIAAQQIVLIPSLLSHHGGSDTSTLYIEQRGYPSPYILDPNSCPGLGTCSVIVEEIDTLDCALKLLRDGGGGVGVLNMASAFLRGGGWLEGTTAQEEQICYRSTLAVTLKAEYYPLPDVYPEEPGYEATDEVGCVFSPEVVVNRRGEEGGYEELPEEEIRVVAVISMAGVDLRGWEGWNQEVEGIKRDKIRLILRVAARRGCRKLVLGALGCGVFRCPPEEVADVFRGVLREKEFKGWWEEVRFAVLGKQNYGAFWSVLNGVEVGEDSDNTRKRGCFA
ncbi:hypothetical protein BZA77DRAFT_241304 [Pyronema omphalodes]|nr:hypothetical protein BZA77DRAFT_241304 [Pyronema omphalodes]